MAPWTDQEAIQRCRSGEADGRDALRLLYDRYASEITDFLRRVLGEDPAIEDAVQDTFVELYRGLGRFDDQRPLRPYLFKTAHNAALKHLQKRKRARGSPLGEAPAPQDTAQIASRREIQAGVQRALLDLAPEHRSVIVLRHIHELKFAEIAEVLGCTDRTARNRLHSAAILFERALEKHGLGAEGAL